MVSLLIAVALLGADKPTLDFEKFIVEEFRPTVFDARKATQVGRAKKVADAVAKLSKLVAGKETTVRVKVNGLNNGPSKGKFSLQGFIQGELVAYVDGNTIGTENLWTVTMDPKLAEDIPRHSILLVKGELKIAKLGDIPRLYANDKYMCLTLSNSGFDLLLESPRFTAEEK